VYRALAFVCLIVGITAVLNQVQAAPLLQDKKKDDPGSSPVILSPQVGDTVGTAIIVTGTSPCSPVMLLVTPPGTTYVEVPVNPDGTWSYTINGVTGTVTITACCKSGTYPTPPHGPCSNVPGLAYSSTPVIGGPGARIDPEIRVSGIPTYKPGQVRLAGRFTYIPSRKQSVHVHLEKAVLANPKTDRTKVETATLDTGAEEWNAPFPGVTAEGLYVVRAYIINRGAKTESTSWVIRVKR
jgi:hypothetical protein